MSAADPWEEWRGMDPWSDAETSTEEVEYPDPDPVAGSIVSCPTCSWVGAGAGFPSHYRRSHADPDSLR